MIDLGFRKKSHHVFCHYPNKSNYLESSLLDIYPLSDLVSQILCAQELMDRTILDVLRTDPDLTTERLVAKALEVLTDLFFGFIFVY